MSGHGIDCAITGTEKKISNYLFDNSKDYAASTGFSKYISFPKGRFTEDHCAFT